MLRKILGVVVGVIAGVLVVAVVEAIGHHIYPPPAGVDLHDPETLKALIPNLPRGALLFVVLAWALGAFSGGAVAGLISRSVVPSLVVGVIQLLFGAMTMVMIPHPVWMIVFGILLPVPVAWVGGRLLSGK